MATGEHGRTRAACLRVKGFYPNRTDFSSGVRDIKGTAPPMIRDFMEVY